MVDNNLLEESDVLKFSNGTYRPWYFSPSVSTASAQGVITEIPELGDAKGRSFGFMGSNSGIAYSNVDWSDVSNQPVPSGWRIPTKDEMMSIFPGTPFAGNFTFRRGENNSTPSAWGPRDDVNAAPIDKSVKAIRFTVPYYCKDDKNHYLVFDTDNDPETGKTFKDSGKYAYYKDAIDFFIKIDDPGVTRKVNGKDIYETSEDPRALVPDDRTRNLDYDPVGDPAPGYVSVYVISRDEENGDLYTLQGANVSTNSYKCLEWGVIYGIKKYRTSEAYRMRWRVIQSGVSSGGVPIFYIEVSRYSCKSTDKLTLDNYKSYSWNVPDAQLTFPIQGYIQPTSSFGLNNYGTETMYTTSTKVTNTTNMIWALRVKVTGNDYGSQFFSVVMNSKLYGYQLRMVRDY
ncbi:MAG: hypothetical protein LUC45_05335 [Paraprevotella sp.]|nr:hypothetical protein [Paraprevotella sp.]